MSEAQAPPSIAGYRVLGPLDGGRTSTGSLWRALDRTGRPVAVRLGDRADRADRASDERRDSTFRREALATLKVRHENLVHGLEVGETADGRPYLALELVEGTTLAQRLEAHGPLPETEAVSMGHALASALEHAHGLGLAHRDVRPDDVVITPDGGVKLVGFNVGEDRGLGEERGLGDGGPASDLYALGATLAEAVLGHPCFEGEDDETSPRVPLVLPERVGNATLSSGFRAVVHRLGRTSAAERYGSAEEVRLDFEALAHGERPPGARPALARMRRILVPDRWLIAVASATAVVWIAVLATPGGGPPSDRPTADSTAVADAPLSAADARAEAALLYLQGHPDDFERGRTLVAESLAANPSKAEADRVGTASLALEARFRDAAAALLAEKTAAARARRDAGDLDGMAQELSVWPEAFRATPEAEQGAKLAESWRKESMVPGAVLLSEGAALLGGWDGIGERAVDAARDLLERMEAHARLRRGDAAQRASVEALRVKVAARFDEATRATRDAAAARALVSALALAGGEKAAGVRAALEKIAEGETGTTAIGRLVTTVVAQGGAVEKALLERTAPLAKATWAAILDDRLFAGTVDAPPSPRAVFAPGWTLAEAGGSATPDIGDLLSVERDPERAASWLVLVGGSDVASTLAPAGGSVRTLLDAARVAGGAAPSALAPPRSGAWADLLRRMPLVLRTPSQPLPALEPGDDAALSAWLDALKSRKATAAGARPAAPGRPPQSVSIARDAFLAGDWLRAWNALVMAAVSAPRDAEVAMLRSRVLDALARPLPTLGVALLALVEARRAWDLDPTLPAGPQMTAEASLRVLSRHPGPLADALGPATLAACEETARLGPATAPILSYAGERRLAEGKTKDALPLLRRAALAAPDDVSVGLLLAKAEDAAGDPKKAVEALEKARAALGAEFPAWARAMLERLGRR